MENRIHRSVEKNDKKAVEEIFREVPKENLVIVLKQKNRNGMTPLHIAIQNRYTDIVEFILNEVSDVDRSMLLQIRNRDEKTPFELT